MEHIKPLHYIGLVPLLHINDNVHVVYLATEIEFNKTGIVRYSFLVGQEFDFLYLHIQKILQETLGDCKAGKHFLEISA